MDKLLEEALGQLLGGPAATYGENPDYELLEQLMQYPWLPCETCGEEMPFELQNIGSEDLPVCLNCGTPYADQSGYDESERLRSASMDQAEQMAKQFAEDGASPEEIDAWMEAEMNKIDGMNADGSQSGTGFER